MRTGGSVPAAERILAAYVGVVIAFLVLPVAVVVPVSLNAGGALALPFEGLSLRWYRNIFARPEFVRSFGVSVGVAVAATTASLALGAAAAHGLVRGRLPGRKLLQLIFVAPLVFPSIAYGVALLILLTPLGLMQTLLGLVLAHTVVTLPYVVRTLAATWGGIDRAVEEAAELLGANRFQVFRHVVLPLIRPGLLAAATFSLIISFDEFTVSLFLVGRDVVTLPLEIYYYIEYIIDPTVAAISTLLVALTVAVVLAIEKSLGFERFFRL